MLSTLQSFFVTKLPTFNRVWRLLHSLLSCLASIRASSRSPSSRRTSDADAGVAFSWPLSLVTSSLVYVVCKNLKLLIEQSRKSPVHTVL